jgi:hypothetical protein
MREFDCPLCQQRVRTDGEVTDVYLAVKGETCMVSVKCWSLGSGFCNATPVHPDPVQLELFAKEI